MHNLLENDFFFQFQKHNTTSSGLLKNFLKSVDSGVSVSIRVNLYSHPGTPIAPPFPPLKLILQKVPATTEQAVKPDKVRGGGLWELQQRSSKGVRTLPNNGEQLAAMSRHRTCN